MSETPSKKTAASDEAGAVVAPESDLVRYYQSRGADPVRCDAEGLRSDGYDVTQAPLQGIRPTATLRHDSRSLALAVMRFYRNHRRERDQ